MKCRATSVAKKWGREKACFSTGGRHWARKKFVVPCFNLYLNSSFSPRWWQPSQSLSWRKQVIKMVRPKILILIIAKIKQNYCLQTPEISRYCPQAPISRNPIWRSKSHLSWELKGWGWQEVWEKQEDFRRGEVNPNQTKPNNTKPISSQFQEHWKWGWCQRQCKKADFLWNF